MEKERRFPWQRIEKISAQESISYEQMTRDGICKVCEGYYSMTVRFDDINYQLAQTDEKNAIFENWCDVLNYFDNTIPFQLSFMNRHGGMKEYRDVVRIAPRDDHLDGIRKEYGGMLRRQLEKGNNGLVRTKYLTFGVEAENFRKARMKLVRIETDVINNFKTVGVRASSLNREERLKLFYEAFHPGDGEKFEFSEEWMRKSGRKQADRKCPAGGRQDPSTPLCSAQDDSKRDHSVQGNKLGRMTTKDFVAPEAFVFDSGRDFQIINRDGTTYGAASYLQITAPELSDKMLADFLELDLEMDVAFHIRSIEQLEAVKHVKAKITDIDRMTIEEQARPAGRE